jgi:hypothetical protein
MCGTRLSASFFDHGNKEAMEKRQTACDAAMDDLITFMRKDGVRLAVYDSTNSTFERRQTLLKRLDDSGIGVKRMFLEAITNDKEVLEQNIKTMKMCTPDYKDMDPEKAVEDFIKRRENYANVYKSVEDNEGSYMKVFDNKKYVIHSVRGYLPLKVRGPSSIESKYTVL